MGFTRVRQGSGGRVRYVAHYHDLKGRQRSAGTFSTRKEADRAWQRTEAMRDVPTLNSYLPFIVSGVFYGAVYGLAAVGLDRR